MESPSSRPGGSVVPIIQAPEMSESEKAMVPSTYEPGVRFWLHRFIKTFNTFMSSRPAACPACAFNFRRYVEGLILQHLGYQERFERMYTESAEHPLKPINLFLALLGCELGQRTATVIKTGSPSDLPNRPSFQFDNIWKEAPLDSTTPGPPFLNCAELRRLIWLTDPLDGLLAYVEQRLEAGGADFGRDAQEFLNAGPVGFETEYEKYNAQLGHFEFKGSKHRCGATKSVWPFCPPGLDERIEELEVLKELTMLEELRLVEIKTKLEEQNLPLIRELWLMAHQPPPKADTMQIQEHLDYRRALWKLEGQFPEEMLDGMLEDIKNRNQW